jgi:hypothetical protein
MKDAFGGIMNLALMVVFLVIAIGILALTVSYAKAFRMKNFVISTVEQYEGIKCDSADSACYNRIVEKAKSIGYHPAKMTCDKGTNVGNYYCIEKKQSDKGGIYYTVQTQVDINFPIVNKALGISVFQVSGDTKYFDPDSWYK